MSRPSTAAVRLLTGEREPVRLATTASLSTTLVKGLPRISGLQIIDGVLTGVGDRVLVKDQTDQTINGIYTASEGYWDRAADARTSRTVQKGTTVHVQEGAASAGVSYAFQTLNPTIGADPISITFYISDDIVGDTGALLSPIVAEAAGARDIAASYASLIGTALPATQFSTVALLVADAVLSYTPGVGKLQVAAGAIIQAQGFRYQVQSSGAASPHLTTAGGIKLNVLRGSATDETNVLAFGAVGNGIADDFAAIQLAINQGGRVFIPAGTFLVSYPLVLIEGSILRGAGEKLTIIRKTASSVNADGIDAIISCRNSTRRIHVEGIQVYGNRSDYAAGNTVTTHGFYFWGAFHSTLRELTARSCLNGFVFKTCYVLVAERLTAQTCQDYGFKTQNSCTSISFSNTLAWGCKGGWDISATVYFSIRDHACDQADAGHHPSDPFLPHGSGGDYQNPGFLFSVVTSRGTFISCGSESSYSQVLYAEGAFIDFINPYFYDLRCNKPTGNWYAFQLRGTGLSNVNITNARLDIYNDVSVASNRAMFFIDSPRVQKIKFDRFCIVDSSFGAYRYPVTGVEFSYIRPIALINPSTMVVGAKSPLYNSTPTDITTDVVASGATKRLAIENLTTSAKTLRMPIDNFGTLFLHFKGSHTSSINVLTARVVADDGVTLDVLLTFNLTGSFDVRNFLAFDDFTAISAKPLYLEIISPHSSDVTRFEIFRAELIL